MDLQLSTFLLCLLVVTLVHQGKGGTPRQTVRFQPTRLNLKRDSPQQLLKTQTYCFKWQQLQEENDKCLEIEIQISSKCDNKPYDTIYVPCDLNINTNSYIGFWILRVWDYLYSDSGQDYYYMNSDGSCLKKTYRRLKAPQDDTVTTLETVMSKAKCDSVKSRVNREAGVLDEQVKKLTWYGVETDISQKGTDSIPAAEQSTPPGKIERWVIGHVVATIRHLPSSLRTKYVHFCEELERVPPT